MNGCRLGFYEPIRGGLASAVYKDAHVQSLGINVFSGAVSGMMGAALGSPFFLVKTRLQSHSPFLPVGTQHNYKNSVDGLRKIHQSEGIKGLYRGVGAAMVRTGFGSSVQLPTYFLAKRRLMRHLGMEDGPALHFASSTASGFVVCCVMHPPGMPIRYVDTCCGYLLTWRQTLSCPACTTRAVISTRECLTACIRLLRPKVSSLFTRASPRIWRVSCLILYVPAA